MQPTNHNLTTTPTTAPAKKFAFLVHLRSSYRADLALMAKPFGWVPDSVYRTLLKGRPFNPFVWSQVTLTPEATSPEGYIIMLPYSGQQLLEQPKEMLPLVEKAMQLAHAKGAEIFGLGALTSPITLGGKLVQQNPHVAITNGNAYTAVITFQKIKQLLAKHPHTKPTVALIGATGSVGSLVAQLMANHNVAANYLLVARNTRRLNQLASQLQTLQPGVQVQCSTCMGHVAAADVVVLLTSASDNLLQSQHLKSGAIVLDDTQPRNTSPALLAERPDIQLIDGGLVSVPHLQFKQRSIALPKGLSFACLAETMLLAQAGHQGNFSVGNPTLEQGEYILNLARQFAHLGFDLAPDHCFGRPLAPQVHQMPTIATSAQPALAFQVA